MQSTNYMLCFQAVQFCLIPAIKPVNMLLNKKICDYVTTQHSLLIW
jgi:hypothetical protein